MRCTRARDGCFRLRQNKRAVGLGQLLIGKQAVIAGLDQAVFGAKFLYGKVGVECPLTQLGNTVGQPVAGPLRRLVFGVQLVHQIGRRHRIDDLGC